jgi:hypothetical protein
MKLSGIQVGKPVSGERLIDYQIPIIEPPGGYAFLMLVIF